MAPANDETQAKRTIKLKPLTPNAQGGAVDDDEKVEDTISMNRSELEEEATLQMSKPEVPGAKETIKLRPSSNAPSSESDTQTSAIPSAKRTIKLKPKAEKNDTGNIGDDQTVPLAKQTIKLVPKGPGKSDETSTQSTPKTTAKPSDPTVNLANKKNNSPTGTTVAQTKPSDPTVKLGGDTAAATAPKKTLQLKKTSAPAPDEGLEATHAQSHRQMPHAPQEQEEATSDEPGIVMTLLSVATFAAMLYLAFVVFAQYWNDWKDETGKPMNVPFLTGNIK